MITVGELIDRLSEYPKDLPVGVDFDPYEEIEIKVMTWVDTNYPYDHPDFEYLSIQ